MSRRRADCIKKLSYDKLGRPKLEFSDRMQADHLIGRAQHVFVDRHELPGVNGGPIAHRDATFDDWPAEELLALATQLAEAK